MTQAIGVLSRAVVSPGTARPLVREIASRLGIKVAIDGADVSTVSTEQYAFAQGMRQTRAALDLWSQNPRAVLGRWVGLSFAVACALLVAVWVVAGMLTPDPTPIHLAGIDHRGTLADMAPILWRNSLVLALHGFACVAGFIAGASMPIAAAERTGFSRWIHLKTASFAILFVCAVTLFSLSTQALFLGFQGATIAAQFEVSNAALIATVLPHALPELTALFLPLAAWLIASRRGDWDQLLAATMVTVLIAIPVLLVTAAIEVFVWPQILDAISPVV